MATSTTTTTTIKRCPETYEETREGVDKHLDDILPCIINKMKFETNELILDHGCATGGTLTKYFLPIAQKTNSIIYALDNSKSMIEYGEKYYSNPNVKYIYGNLIDEPSPLKNLKFNKIFSLLTLHYIDDYKCELKALAELLSPNGEMFMTVPIECHMFDIFSHVKGHEKWQHHAKDHLVVPQWLGQDKEPLEILKQDLLDLGFEIEEISTEEKIYTYKNPNTLADMFFALNGFAKHLSQEDHDELKNTYRKFNLEKETKTHKPHPESANKEYHLHYNTLHALVKKL